MTRGVAVCGADGLDEITLTGETLVCEIRFGKVKGYTISRNSLTWSGVIFPVW